MQLENNLRKECKDLPKQWPPGVKKQIEAEDLSAIDRSDSLNCSRAGLSYADHISTRDKALMGTVKK